MKSILKTVNFQECFSKWLHNAEYVCTNDKFQLNLSITFARGDYRT